MVLIKLETRKQDDICLFFEFFVLVVEAINQANKNSFYLLGKKASSSALALKMLV